VLGSAIIKGQATEVVDVGHFLPLAFEDWFRGKGAAAAPKRQAVLLVDDSPFFRNMLAPVLQAAGFAVTPVASAAEAIEHIKAGHAFDVVITDVDMPGMDGFELAEMLRADPLSAQWPVIGLSAAVSADAVERGRRAGFYDFVAKFDRQGLIASLKERGEFGRVA